MGENVIDISGTYILYSYKQHVRFNRRNKLPVVTKKKRSLQHVDILRDSYSWVHCCSTYTHVEGMLISCGRKVTLMRDTLFKKIE